MNTQPQAKISFYAKHVKVDFLTHQYRIYNFKNFEQPYGI